MCEKLKKVSLPKNVEMDVHVFIGSKALADKDGFVIVNNTLFGYYGESQDVIIPDGVTSISGCVFSESEIKSVVIPEGVTKIAERAFEVCKNLSKVTIPQSVKKIEKDAFASCPRLTTIVIPEGVTEIEEAFRDSNRLKKVFLPKSVTNIAHYAISYKTTIYAPAGSYAESYAKENKIPFVAE